MKNILIEEILPLNYYSQMCGIMADMQVILDLLKKLMPKYMRSLMIIRKKIVVIL